MRRTAKRHGELFTLPFHVKFLCLEYIVTTFDGGLKLRLHPTDDLHHHLIFYIRLHPWDNLHPDLHLAFNRFYNLLYKYLLKKFFTPKNLVFKVTIQLVMQSFNLWTKYFKVLKITSIH